MPKPWFKRAGRFCSYPISWQGWVVTILVGVFCAQIFIAVDRNSHSVSDTLYGVFPFIVPALLVWELIADRTRKE